jgi:uncharacterized protein (UPF0147 family)
MGDINGFELAVSCELAQNVLNVITHRSVRDAQIPGNIVRAASGSQQRKHFAFSAR